MGNLLVLTPEIKNALENKLPVVALESTIISHGMPYPQNVEMAKQCEKIIRDSGVVPATIALMDGKILVGLSEDNLMRLATEKDVTKVSRRDFAHVLSEKKTGATTVATTMICAEMAGIKFFVTGGIGGVHRGYEHSLDVSADLEELAQTDVTVICAGAKSILDIPRTLEYLETKGVPVIGYQTGVLPEFFTNQGTQKLNIRLDTPEKIAELIKIKDALTLKGGILVANPIPDAYSLEKESIDAYIDEAIVKAAEQNIVGKDVTPFLLGEIVKETGGKSLEANIQLVYHNARVGSMIAKAYWSKN